MRVKVNLASRPYQDIGRLIVRWSVVLAAVGVITIGLVYLALGAVFSWRSAKNQERDLRAQIDRREQVRTQAESFLNRRENRSARDQSEFINALIARKAFSWTDVLSDLERTVPTGIHVVSIRPKVNENSQLELLLTVAGSSRDARDRAIELVQRLEGSQHFRDAALVNETSQTAKDGIRFQFDIVSQYIPSYQRSEPAQSDSATQPELQAKKGGQR
jgi:hypothetical protein